MNQRIRIRRKIIFILEIPLTIPARSCMMPGGEEEGLSLSVICSWASVEDVLK